MLRMTFELVTREGSRPVEIEYDRLIAIGYAGRNTEKTMEHIRELERDLGVPAPKRIPTIFNMAPQLLTQDSGLLFAGDMTSGEAEYVMIMQGGRLYIGLGSDHTDRNLESSDVLKAKQVCLKPVAGILWDYEELKDHWDSIALGSDQVISGGVRDYQNGSLADIMTPELLLDELKERTGDISHAVIFSGTVPLLSGFAYGDHFSGFMRDGALGREIRLEYDVNRAAEDE